ncbi:MAG TPA: methylmalonyl-CoA mutase family protein [Chthoniobacteraceae bacterium]|nr:methylmalonyl-CoA mutase family protein [Chthoniobacteraceae bacterium]
MNTHENMEKGNSLTFDEFPIPTYEAWRAEAELTLAGAPFEKKLVTQTYEGIGIQPIYRREDIARLPLEGALPGRAPFLRGIRGDNAWQVAQELACGANSGNETIRNDFEHGQTALNLVLDDGAPVKDVNDFDALLKGIDLSKTPLFLQTGPAALPLFALLVAHLHCKGEKTAALRGALALDPLADLVRSGSLPWSLESAFDQMAVATKWSLRNAPDFNTIAVRTHAWHNAGANSAQELAFALATGVEYLRRMEERGLKVDEAAPGLYFGYSIGTDFFMAIAKFRAARILWSRIVAVSGGCKEAQKARIHARTSTWARTSLDPHVNMLRGTTEAFAAIAGGCDSLHVAPFDATLREPDDFSRRIARNTQLILRDECHFDQVIDPSGGSYYVETLTAQLAEKAWTLFREIEALGGMAKAVLAGVPQKQVNATAAKKAEAIAQRRNSIIGVNVYANPLEKPAERQALSSSQAVQIPALSQPGAPLPTGSGKIFDEAVQAALEGATLTELFPVLTGTGGPANAERLPARRASEPFEKLRAAVDAAGKPKVFLANMGPLRQHKARADFTTGFFQAGGFAVEENRGFKTTNEAIQAALNSNAQVVVICSTDETYPELVPPITGLIKASRPKTIVVVAGYPKELIEPFKAAGVDEFIHIRANCLETLSGIARKLGVNI